MANTKNALLRLMVIDRCLRDYRRNFTTLDIMRECNRALSSHGMMEVASANTIREDIMAIEDQWQVEVERIVSGRNRYYRYADPNFSIFRSSLNTDQKERFLEAIKLLKDLEEELLL